MIRPKLKTPPTVSVLDIEEVKSHLRVYGSDDDTLLQSYIDAATSVLDGHSGELGRCLLNQVWTTVHCGWSWRMPSPFPGCSAAVVKYFDTDDAEQTVSASNYRVYPEYILFKQAFVFPTTTTDRDDQITIDWTCGYGEAATDVPKALRQGMMTLIAHWYENREAVMPNERRVELEMTPFAFRYLVDQFRVPRF